MRGQHRETNRSDLSRYSLPADLSHKHFTDSPVGYCPEHTAQAFDVRRAHLSPLVGGFQALTSLYI